MSDMQGVPYCQVEIMAEEARRILKTAFGNWMRTPWLGH